MPVKVLLNTTKSNYRSTESYVSREISANMSPILRNTHWISAVPSQISTIHSCLEFYPFSKPPELSRLREERGDCKLCYLLPTSI